GVEAGAQPPAGQEGDGSAVADRKRDEGDGKDATKVEAPAEIAEGDDSVSDQGQVGDGRETAGSDAPERRDRPQSRHDLPNVVLPYDVAEDPERGAEEEQAHQHPEPAEEPFHAGGSTRGTKCRKKKDFVNSEAATYAATIPKSRSTSHHGM